MCGVMSGLSDGRCVGNGGRRLRRLGALLEGWAPILFFRLWGIRECADG